MARPRGRLLMVAVGALAGLTLAVTGVVTFGSLGSSSDQITFTAPPGGHISPVGTQAAKVGSTVVVTAWSDRSEEVPDLLIDGVPVQTASGSDGKWTYSFVVDHQAQVTATFAQLSAAARPLDVQSASLLSPVSSDGAQVVFLGRTPFIDSLKPGDVLTDSLSAGRVDLPFLRILDIVRSGDRTTLTTAPALLTDVVQAARIQIDEPLHPVGTPPAGATAVRPVQIGPFRLGPDTVLAGQGDRLSDSLDTTWQGEVGGSVHLGGSLSIDSPRLQMDVDIDLLAGCPFSCHISVNIFRLSVSENASADLSVGTSGSVKVTKSFTAAKHDFGIIVVPLGPVPVPITPKLEIGASIDADTSASVQVGGAASAGLQLGVKWKNGRWSPIANAHADLSGRVGVDATAHVRVTPTVDVTALVAGLCGPYFEVGPGYVDLSSDIAANPWWVLTSGVSAAGGASCSFADPYQMASADLVTRRILDSGGPFAAPIASIRASSPSPSPSSPVMTSAPSATVFASGSPAASFATMVPTIGPLPILVPPTVGQIVAAAQSIGLTCLYNKTGVGICSKDAAAHWTVIEGDGFAGAVDWEPTFTINFAANPNFDMSSPITWLFIQAGADEDNPDLQSLFASSMSPFGLDFAAYASAHISQFTGDTPPQTVHAGAFDVTFDDHPQLGPGNLYSGKEIWFTQ